MPSGPWQQAVAEAHQELVGEPQAVACSEQVARKARPEAAV